MACLTLPVSAAFPRPQSSPQHLNLLSARLACLSLSTLTRLRLLLLLFVLLSDGCKLVGYHRNNAASVIVVVVVRLFRLGGMSVEVDELAELADISFEGLLLIEETLQGPSLVDVGGEGCLSLVELGL